MLGTNIFCSLRRYLIFNSLIKIDIVQILHDSNPRCPRPLARSVKLWRTILGVISPWHGARVDFLARFILALLQVRFVHLARLVLLLSERAEIISSDIGS